jgi:hypothetical protein
MWAVLYEKALAKHRGGYGYLRSGFAADAFKLFNSKPVVTLLKQNQTWIRWDTARSEISEVREQIKSFMTLEYIVTAGIFDTALHEPSPVAIAAGLNTGHAYSVLRIAELTIDGESSPTVLIKLRDPWGQTEWIGDWSDLSDKWLKFDVAKKLNHQPRDDGIFWMPLEDFLKYFNTIDVSCTILRSTCESPHRKLAATINKLAP